MILPSKSKICSFSGKIHQFKFLLNIFYLIISACSKRSAERKISCSTDFANDSIPRGLSRKKCKKSAISQASGKLSLLQNLIDFWKVCNCLHGSSVIVVLRTKEASAAYRSKMALFKKVWQKIKVMSRPWALGFDWLWWNLSNEVHNVFEVPVVPKIPAVKFEQ